MNRPSIASRLAGGAMALLFAVSMATPAFADATVTEGDLSELQERIETSGAAYDEACAKADELDQQAEENRQRIAEVEAKLPEQREKAAAAISASYKMQQNTPGLMGLVLSSENFNQFLATITYLNAVEDHNSDQIQGLADLQDELEQNQAELTERQEEAAEQKEAAENALNEAKAAREEAQRQAEEQARREAEAAAKAVAEAQAQAEKEAAAAKEATPAPQPSSSTPSQVNWSSDKSAFVAEWAPRIDAYLAGSPLAGQGKTFADAAWDYGVDPRWSPAISNTESSKGAVCFKPYNAWGWGNSSWGSWEEAIRDHVAGLARGYGSTISLAAAQKYCPPNANHWYSATLAEMERI